MSDPINLYRANFVMSKMLQVNTNIWNLSLGEVLANPVEISLDLRKLKGTELSPLNLQFKITNTSEHFLVEEELAAYHSMENKQNFSYNPRASGWTANLVVVYEDYEGEELMWSLHYAVNNFLNSLAGILGFLQRRRIIIGGVNLLPTKTDHVWLGGVNFSGEFIDSVGYGQVAVDPKGIQSALVAAVDTFLGSALEHREHLTVLLRRYNDVLNLPYTYERFDGYWRIVEGLGRGATLSSAHEAEYKRVCTIAGAPNGSKNLRSFVGALLQNDIAYSDDAIAAAFKYRNESTHEYLSKSVIDDPKLPDNFHFVAECADRLIFKRFGIDQSLLKVARHSIIVNRVV